MQSIKKKRVSKKLKVSWRKHVNIEDVEDYLEDKRLEERLGPPLSTITNDELFKLDTTPTTEVLSARERKKLRLNKPLKCFSALQPHTKVPDPIGKRNRVRSKEERRSSIVKKNEMKNALNGVLKQKQVQAAQNRKLAELKRKSKHNKWEFNIDIWDHEDKINPELSNQWVTTNCKKHNLKNSGVPQKDVLPSLKDKKSALPSIEVPHPGMSYNPTFADHQHLLTVVADKESKLMKKEAYLTRVTKGMFSKMTEVKRDSEWLVEMSEGLPSQEGTNAEENETAEDYKPVNPPVKNAKKSVKQRRKQKEQKVLELARRAKKMEKKKVTDIHLLKVLHKEMEKAAKKQNLLMQLRKKRKLLKKDEAKRLSSTKFEEPDLDFNMCSDIAGNLRNVKKEGSLLIDRFRSLQKRNILEASRKRVRKSAKVKRYTKSGHKEDWKKTVAR